MTFTPTTIPSPPPPPRPHGLQGAAPRKVGEARRRALLGVTRGQWHEPHGSRLLFQSNSCILVPLSLPRHSRSGPGLSSRLSPSLRTPTPGPGKRDSDPRVRHSHVSGASGPRPAAQPPQRLPPARTAAWDQAASWEEAIHRLEPTRSRRYSHGTGTAHSVDCVTSAGGRRRSVERAPARRRAHGRAPT